jgi:hypothetical protein
MDSTFQSSIDRYVAFLKEDYLRATDYMEDPRDPYEVRVEGGRQFVKIVALNYGAPTTHSFVMIQDVVLSDRAGNKRAFRMGDIMPPADNFTPRLNYTIGNTMDDNYGTIRWSKYNIKQR